MKIKNILKEKIDDSSILINATSVGMKEDVSLIEDKTFRDDLVVSDCIYSAKQNCFKYQKKKDAKS
ncbi:hypothetical protein OGZ02_11460 [Brachyspira hyodysenteriae]|nr:hypothetical protein [Brachyspira hyodysenteriae]MDA1469447.1 hypothetical protein [Brachyspira hyodysenteriae]